ncbi:hypothetical protein RHMOL_Rhmol11G0154700 [Rhododendron molle]|uniref:Uncharacterized protein n=1 Tax=Rhododendron molle TaxID=49168 RepID=A0ACC0LST1_RHOML|nr:hypothetical protein RHMOL_Rhmol11G0154700 [Rhododendron molle]
MEVCLLDENACKGFQTLTLCDLPKLESFCTKLGKVGTTEGNSTIHALPLFNGKAHLLYHY